MFTAIRDTTKTKVYVNANGDETTPVARDTSIADVQRTPDRYFVSGGFMYLHLRDGSDPSRFVIEAQVCDYAVRIHGVSGIKVHGVHLIHANHNGLFAWTYGSAVDGLALDESTLTTMA